MTTLSYATHIFDGIGEFATHIVHLDNGTVNKIGKLDAMAQLLELRERRRKGITVGDDSALLLLVEEWLRGEFDERKRRKLASGGAEVKSRLQELSDDYKTHRDKFYNYWK